MELAPRTAAICYLTPATDGQIVTAPAPFSHSGGAVDIGLRVLRQTGDTIAITHSNKDYLGILTGVGSDADSVHQALAQAGAGLAWEIRR